MDWNAQGWKSRFRLNAMTTAAKSSKSTGRRSRAITTSEALIGSSSSPLTLSAADSLVSHSLLPGSDEARQMTVTSGRRWFDAWTLSGPLGSLAKMCLGSSIWGSSKCLLTWRPLVIKQQCLGFRLVPSMPRTSGNDSGFYPTPRKCSGKRSSGVNRTELYRAMSKFLPTPTMADAHGGPGNSGRDGGENLRTVIGGPIHPHFVEWMQGYPEGWTELKRSETLSSHKSRKR